MFGLIPFRTNNVNEKGVTFSDFFNDFFNDDFLSPMGMSIDNSKFKTDVRETANEYLVCAELPGVKKEDISLDYKDNNLIITATRNEVHNENTDNYVRKERSYGEFSRSFYFDNVEKEKICAKFENGELKIILPKDKKKTTSSKIFIQ